VQARGAAGHRAPEKCLQKKMRRPKGGGRRRKREKKKIKKKRKAKIPPPDPLLFAFLPKRASLTARKNDGFGAVEFIFY